MDEVNLGLLFLRVTVGLTFASHGWAKVFRGGRLPGTARWFDSMGMRPGWLHARVAASLEMASGVLLALGLVTPFAAAAIVGLMTVAGWTVHRPNGFFSVRDGWEFNWVLAVTAVGVATTGPGEWSVDEALGIADDLDGAAGLALAAGLGVVGAVVHLAAFWRPAATEP